MWFFFYEILAFLFQPRTFPCPKLLGSSPPRNKNTGPLLWPSSQNNNPTSIPTPLLAPLDLWAIFSLGFFPACQFSSKPRPKFRFPLFHFHNPEFFGGGPIEFFKPITFSIGASVLQYQNAIFCNDAFFCPPRCFVFLQGWNALANFGVGKSLSWGWWFPVNCFSGEWNEF